VSVAVPVALVAIGCGRVFERFYLPALGAVPELALLGICEADAARRAVIATRLSGVAAGGSLDGLALSRPAEAALVLTPPTTHRDLVTQALLAGMHVLVEKPMALTSGDARAMAEAADRTGRRLHVGFNRRFRTTYQELQRQVREAGTVRDLRCALRVPSTTWGAQGGFLGDDTQGGGVLDDVLSHQVDLVRWMTGAEPRRVRCFTREDGGVTCELQLESDVTAQCVAAHGPYVELLEVALGDGSVLAASGARTYRRRGYAGRLARGYAWLSDWAALAVARVTRTRGMTVESFVRQLRDFAAGIRGGEIRGALAADGAAAVGVVEGARASLRVGSWRDVG
jgi:predicted dehydrogenase